MIRELGVRLLPSSILDDDCQGRCVVMADILRASTTMVQAIANGAASVFPCASIDESISLADRLPKPRVLGGERGGEIIPGFDCGNSPLEYTVEQISGRALVLCTTNGTQTLTHCRGADRLLIGAFVNLSAVCRQLEQHEAGLIACAGTAGRVTDEDVLFAGAVADRLAQSHEHLVLDDAARIVRCRWQSVERQIRAGARLHEFFAISHGGRNLMKLQYDLDVDFCAQIDRFDIVPELSIKDWVIRPQPSPPDMTFIGSHNERESDIT